MKIDRKFKILAVNPVNGKIYDESNSLLLYAKDVAVPAALVAYHAECVRIGANAEHVESIRLLLERVKSFQDAAGGGRIPDTIARKSPVASMTRNWITEGITDAANTYFTNGYRLPGGSRCRSFPLFLLDSRLPSPAVTSL